MFNRTRRKQKGFTLLELLVAIALFAIVVPAIISFSRTAINNNANLGNQTIAVNQLKNAFNYMSQDAQMAGQVVVANSPATASNFPLTLNWTNYPSDQIQVVYSIVNGNLQRAYTDAQDASKNNTMIVATNINTDPAKTKCDWPPSDTPPVSNNILTIDITVTIGNSSAVREFRITPRVIQSINTQTSTTLSGSSTPNNSVFGTSVNLTATISPIIASGDITFLSDGNTIGTSHIMANGQATYPVSSLSVGTHSMTAVYSGDANYQQSTSAPWIQTVTKANATISFSPAPTPSPSGLGVPVIFKVVVTPAGATGTVTFRNNPNSTGIVQMGTPITLVSGMAEYDTGSTDLVVGSNSITVVYSGDSNINGVTSSAYIQTVTKSTPTVAVSTSGSPTTFGQSVTFTANVSGSAGMPTGTVSFKDGGTTMSGGTVTLDGTGTATFTISTLAYGSHTITALYNGDSNYVNTATGTLSGVQTVNKQTLTITANAQSKTYGQTVSFGAGSTLFTSAGLQNSDTIGSVTLAVSGSGGANTAAVGTYTITPSAATGGTFTAANYNITYVTGTLTVNQAALTITASNQSKTYGTAYTFGSGSTQFTSTGLQNGQTIGSVTLACTGGPATSAAGSYTITPSLATGGTFTSGNYSITYATGTLTVSPAALTVTASNQAKTYGTLITFGSGSASFTSSGLKNGETIGSVTLACTGGASNAAVAASPYTITPSLATGGTFTASNYTITYTNGTLTVSTAALTVTASAQSKTYGTVITFGAGSTLFTSSGLKNGETIGSVTLAVSGSGGAGNAAVGTYTITPSAATGGTFTAGNYTITYSTGTLTVSTAALTITANAQSKTFGQTVTFGAGSTLFTPTGLQNGETIGSVTLAVSGSGGANTAAVGTYTITPSAATGGTFTAGNYSITYATGTLTVNPAALTVTASAESKTYGQTVTFGAGSTLFTSSGLQNGNTIGSVTLACTGGPATTAAGTYTITPSLATGGTFTASNYTITYATGTLTVNPAALTVTASAQSKTYGQTVTFGAGSTLFTSSALQNGETIGSVTLAVSGSGGAATAAAGTYTITPSLATGGTFTASNYSITYNTGTLTVGTAAVTVTANAQSKTFGQTVTFGAGSTLFTSSALQNGETIGSVTLAVSGSGGAATAAVGTYTITPSLATGGTFTAGNYTITYATGTLTVNPAALTVTASAQSKTYGQTVTFGAGSTLFTSTGLQNGNTIGSVTLAVSGSGGAATAAVGTYTITPSLATGGTFTASNYTITYATGTLTVNQAALTITANAQSKTYGQTVTFGAGSILFTPTGLQNGETIGSVTLACTGGPATTAVGSYTITPSLATGGTFTASNYSITYATGNLTVSTAALTVTANAQSKTYGQTVTFGAGSTLFTPTGLQNGETIGSVTLAVSGSGGAATAAVGSYTITPSLATGGTFTAGNYSITYSTGTLTVSTAALTVTASNQSKTYGSTYTFGAGSSSFTSSGLQNGDTIGTVTLACTGGPATTAVGTYTITPSLATGGTFTASNYSITYNTGTLTVLQMALTVTANAQSKTYGQTVTFGAGSTLFTPTGLKNGETIGSVTLACTGGPATTAVGSYTITPSAAIGGTFTASNYSITYATGTLTVNQAALTITANAQSKTYGQTVTFGAGSTLFTPTGLQNGETIGSVTLAVSGSGGAATAAVGTYTITPSLATGGTFTAGNYSITYATGNLTVSTAALTVTASAQSKTYGQTVTFGAGSTLFTSIGLQNGDTIGSVTLACTGGASNAAATTYTITPSLATGGTFTAGNYTITYATGTLTVNQAALTVTASAESKTYGQTVTFGAGSTLFTSGGLQNGETIGSVTLACTGGPANTAVGTYTITPSLATGGTFTAGNYSITYNTGTLTVNTAALTITANAQSKTYGQTVTFGSGSTLFTPTGLQNGETIGSVTLACTGGPATTVVGTYTITPSLATGGTFTASNYSITYNTGTLTVSTAALTITANAQSKTYGQIVTFGAGSTLFTPTGLQNGETVGTVTLAVSGSGGAATAAAGSYTITPSLATGGTFTAGNYSVTYATGTLTVNPAALTITANAQGKTFGQTLTFGAGSTLFTSSALQNGETVGSVTLACTGGVNTAAAGTYTITPSLAAGGTFTAGNYSITYNTGTLTVNPAGLIITASAESKTYGQTLTFGAGSSLFTSNGLQNGNTIGSVTLACTGGPGTTAVGTYTITPSAATGGTFTAANYTISYNTGTLTVNQAALTITAIAQIKAYGTALTFGSGSTLFTPTGLQNGETIGSVTLACTGGPATTAVGSYTITPSLAIGGTFAAGNYSITYAANTLTVNAAALTVTANDQSKTYGQTLTFGAGSTLFTPAGLQNGETIGSVTLACTGGASNAAATTYTITPSLATGGTFTAGNYTITYAAGTLTVNKAALTITANDQSKTYGQTVSFGAGSTLFTPTGLQNGETIGSVTLACTGGASNAAVTTYTITPSLATGGTFTAGNYSITYSTGTLTVSTAALTVTASNQSKTYGSAYTFGAGSSSFTSSALQNGETIGTVTLACTGGPATTAVGTYTITPSLATGGTFTASNYSITYNTGTLTVLQMALTVTANAQSKTYGQTVTFGAGSTLFTPTGLKNGETIGTVTLACTGGPATTAVGTYTITPSLATGGTFTASNYSITYNTGTLTVLQMALTVTANAQSKTYGQTVTFGAGSTLFTPTGLKNGETIGSVTLACTGGAGNAAVGTYTITPSLAIGGTFAAGNYSITYAANTLTVNAAALTVTANDQSKTYGQTLTFGAGSTLFTPAGLQNGETIGSVTLACTGGASNAAATTYTITPSLATGGTFTAGNYTITYAAGTLTVNKAALTITANDQSKTYGQTVSFGAGSTLFTPTGLQNGETIGSVTLACTGGASNAAVTTYTITPSLATGGTFTAGNYSITYATGTLTVNPAALTVTASNQSKTYGSAYTFGAGSSSFTSSALQNGETIGTVTLACTGGPATTAVGTYTITPSAATGGTFTASNYSITYNTGTLTVLQMALTITANAQSKTYGQTVTFGAGSTLFTSIGLKNGETIGTVTLACTGGAGNAAVGTYTITPSAAIGGTFTASNYSITYATGTLTVNKAALTVTASAESKTYGQTLTFGAGSTLFTSSGLQNGETIGTVTLACTGGPATTAVGTYTITPSLATGGTFTAGNYSITYNTGTLTVTKGTSTTAVTSSLNPAAPGHSVTFTATVTPSAAAGTVTFKDAGTALPGSSTVTLSGGVATFAISTLSTGSHTITAVYNGDSNCTGSTSPTLTQTVGIVMTNIGQNNSTTSNTSLSVTVPAGGVAVGNTIIVSFAMDPNAGAVSVADTSGNTYHTDADVSNTAGGIRTLVICAPVTTALAAGNTITVTYPATTSKAVSIYYVDGTATSDKTSTGMGTSTAPSSGNTAATTQASELLIGAIGSESYNTTFTVGGSYIAMNSAIANTGTTNTSISIFPEYRVVSATGAYSATGTLSTSRDWAAAIVTYIVN